MAGRLAPSAFSRKRELRFPPLISCEKDGGLPPVTSEKTLSLMKHCSVIPKGVFSLNV